PGYHTTGRSAAMFLETYGPVTVQRLTKASRNFFERPPGGFSEQPLLSLRASVFLARSDQEALLERLHTALATLTPSVARLKREAALDLVPVLRPDYVSAALIEPDAREIDVNALHQGYLTGLKARGGRLATAAEVTEIAAQSEDWRVESRAGSFRARQIVNAAGAWCDEIAQLAGLAPLGLVPKRRTVVTLDPPAGVDPRPWPLVSDIAETFYFKPESGRIFASPADETPSPPCDAQPEELDVAVAVDRLERATTLEVRRIVNKWAGLRSFLPDRSLAIGPDPAAPTFLWFAGQGGYGIQTAPAAAKALAGLASSARLSDELLRGGLMVEALSPRRFSARRSA
ncbi:MAG: NAD(P)/FAD-dependent oxidoreductase, partial [Kiloniellales bacterium]